METKDVPPTQAWLLMGMSGSAPGVLQVVDGRLTCTVHGRGALTGGQVRTLAERTGRPGLPDELTAGTQVVLLDVPVGEIGGVTFPWYTFGAGMNVAVGSARYRFSFIKPQNATEDLEIFAVPGSRATGRTWRAALGG
jgi:hypothetical protein